MNFSFSHLLTSENIFIKDHLIKGLGSVLPGAGFVALLVQDVQKQFPEKNLLSIDRLFWKAPVVVSENLNFTLRLTQKNSDVFEFGFYEVHR